MYWYIFYTKFYVFIRVFYTFRVSWESKEKYQEVLLQWIQREWLRTVLLKRPKDHRFACLAAWPNQSTIHRFFLARRTVLTWSVSTSYPVRINSFIHTPMLIKNDWSIDRRQWRTLLQRRLLQVMYTHRLLRSCKRGWTCFGLALPSLWSFEHNGESDHCRGVRLRGHCRCRVGVGSGWKQEMDRMRKKLAPEVIQLIDFDRFRRLFCTTTMMK